MSTIIRDTVKQLGTDTREAWRELLRRGPSQFQFWLIALFIGISGGFAALLFRKSITALQAVVYGADGPHGVVDAAAALPWYLLLIIPIIGGLVVGLILHNFTPDGRVRSVADVIEGAALHDGRVEKRAGLASACASLITLSTGGSTGREGPVVHLAGVISTWVSNRFHAGGVTGRELLGCAVAAAVSASFNAPIAGAIFALEVVLRHFAVHAFAPIAIAAVAGTVVSRLEFGNVPEFNLTREGELAFYVELPAFLILGVMCGLIAVFMMRSIFWADNLGTWVQGRIGFPRWLRPAIAGAFLGVIAIWFPHVIGVGMETTSGALSGTLLLREAIIFVIIKGIATSITMAGRMGGGVFGPAMMVGALSGLAFGIIATSILPEVSGSHTLYALAGMGAVGGAVLGAPISTTLIVFELTGDWQTGLAVMVAVSISTLISSRMVNHSFFLTQLENRDVHLAAGPQAYVLAMQSTTSVMRAPSTVTESEMKTAVEMMQAGQYVIEHSTLEQALPMFDRLNAAAIPVVRHDDDADHSVVGVLFHIDALKAYNRALSAVAAEEHS